MDEPEQKLADCRRRIDEIDLQLADLLNARIGVVAEVGKLKADNWPCACHIRPAREGQMHVAIAKHFQDKPFPTLAALALWRQIIGASTHIESPLNVVTLDGSPEHVWIAREYFGIQIGHYSALSLVDAFAHMRNGTCNILILPDPATSEWWKAGEAIRAAELAIFAKLPVTGNNLPAGVGAVVALAKLTPEDSGDDISYHVDNGELITRAGFHPEEAGIFLGAHPRTISLGA